MEQYTIVYYLVDVFTNKRFGGNQLAVFIDFDDLCDDRMMLQIARELNLAETTFIKAKIDDQKYRVRIFTTEYEVPFAGHPALGTSFIIARHLLEKPTDKIILALNEGDIPITISNPSNLEDAQFTMQQVQPRFYDEYHANKITLALHLNTADLDPKFPIQRISTGLEYIIIPLLSLKAIQALDFDDRKVIQWLIDQKLHNSNSHTGRTTSLFFMTHQTLSSAHDYHVRMFCVESDRLLEDAATGSANGCLLAYLLKHTNTDISATVEQGSEMGRPSLIYLTGEKTKNEYTIHVGGHVVPVAEGRWHL